MSQIDTESCSSVGSAAAEAQSPGRLAGCLLAFTTVHVFIGKTASDVSVTMVQKGKRVPVFWATILRR